MTSIEPIRRTEATTPNAQVSVSVLGDGLRLVSGVEILDEWADEARQIELNAVQDALFAMLDRSVYADYEVIDDVSHPRHMVVVVRETLAIRIRLNDIATFGIEFIGQPVDALAPFGDSTI